MAEGFELPEKPDSHSERIVGLIIAAIAVVLAVVSALAHETQNKEILAHVDGADQYAYYQAKKERAFALQLSMDSIQLHESHVATGGDATTILLLKNYIEQQNRLNGEGKEAQDKGKEFMDEATHLEHKAGVLDIGEIALQISIVLCSITILTEQRLFVILGVITAGIGIAVSLWGIVVG